MMNGEQKKIVSLKFIVPRQSLYLWLNKFAP